MSTHLLRPGECVPRKADCQQKGLPWPVRPWRVQYHQFFLQAAKQPGHHRGQALQPETSCSFDSRPAFGQVLAAIPGMRVFGDRLHAA